MKKPNIHIGIFFAAGVALVLLFCAGLCIGTTHISLGDVWHALFGAEETTDSFIVVHSRLPRTLLAGFAGAGLALSGLLMQTFFRNELAGPSVLGISSGASLGVALVMLAGAGFAGTDGHWTLVGGAVTGSMAVLWIVLAVSRIFRESGTLLIFGLMLSYIVGALVSVFQAGADSVLIKSYVQWGFGSFDVRTGQEPVWVGGALILALVTVLPTVKWFNAFLLGNENARALGTPLRKVQWSMLLAGGIITGTVTSFCGPVAFIGLAVPHLVRGLFRTSDHAVVLPGSILLGAATGLLCDVLVRAEPAGMILPLNAVTSLIGAPVVIWVILKNAKMKSLL